MDAGILRSIRTHSQRFTNNPNEKFLLMILGSQAKLENDNRGVNVKRGLRTRAEMGLWTGLAPLGYLNQRHMDKKGQVVFDEERAFIIKQMFEKVAYDKWSGRKIYNWLKFDLNFKTRGNKTLTLSGVFRILSNTFYYGIFEKPIGSGNWYQGKHKSLITQDLFEKVQAQLQRDNIQRENKEFAFTKLFICGYCGSGISAEEKYKNLKNGSTTKYIYYGCSRNKDRFCKNKYIQEPELIKQLLTIIDEIDINELGIKAKMEEEIKRFNHFQKSILGETSNLTIPEETTTKNYLKYLLKEGRMEEKREVMGNLRGRMVYVDKHLDLLC